MKTNCQNYSLVVFPDLNTSNAVSIGYLTFSLKRNIEKLQINDLERNFKESKDQKYIFMP